MFALSNKRAAFSRPSEPSQPRRNSTSAATAASRRPRLDRRNANKNIDYDATASSWTSSASSSDDSQGLRATRSLDFHYSDQTSFRIEGLDGEVDQLCRSLGLSGPEEFAIPAADWEARKSRANAETLPPSSLLSQSSCETPLEVVDSSDNRESRDRSPSDHRADLLTADDSPLIKGSGGNSDGGGINGARPPVLTPPPLSSPKLTSSGGSSDGGGGRGGGGIKGVRPPVLTPPPVPSPRLKQVLPLPPSRQTPLPSPPSNQLPSPSSRKTLLPSPPSKQTLPPPPSMVLPSLEKMGSTWDLLRSFAPDDDEEERKYVDSEDDVVEDERAVHLRMGETFGDMTGSCSYSTSNDDDSSSTTTETIFVISPNGRFKRSINSWMRGRLLGSGSFGTVFEGISDDGFFFAVKEVSLLDQGSNANQCIIQLEQEIALLSQFEHDNIVQYFGSDKEEAKLYIFLELVSQGSLASLYQRYHLRDSQVSAYTRQILSGLKYLHDRNVVHRDIKCANILVSSNGSVKLADFGLAKEITKLNVLKSCKGSVYWMAPEVVNPKSSYGPAADIWSLGCTVLEMLTRQVPYPNLEWPQAFYKIGQGEKPPIPNILSRDARDFIQKCVQFNPDDRPTASELMEHPFIKTPLSASTSPDVSLRNGRRQSG
ncbi:Mitogen-activated protein kinase kinase kinase protein [Dioscorea alata]|uniref:Mitogen-activated protein kinase kinase kinase protein n=1 Tax=Dioscorea alata TaxID=55571 RepID=A0ACB7U350_DIOAL|nr:Mitogen-activated protein kinase kinase kinase protein [Dioscorea alata]